MWSFAVVIDEYYSYSIQSSAKNRNLLVIVTLLFVRRKMSQSLRFSFYFHRSFTVVTKILSFLLSRDENIDLLFCLFSTRTNRKMHSFSVRFRMSFYNHFDLWEWKTVFQFQVNGTKIDLVEWIFSFINVLLKFQSMTKRTCHRPLTWWMRNIFLFCNSESSGWR